MLWPQSTIKLRPYTCLRFPTFYKLVPEVSSASEEPLINQDGVHGFSLGKLTLVTMFKAYRVHLQRRIFYFVFPVNLPSCKYVLGDRFSFCERN